MEVYPSKTVAYQSSKSVLSLQMSLHVNDDPGTVPECYVRSDLEHPIPNSSNNISSFVEIPTIDLNNLMMTMSSRSEEESLGLLELENLHSACKEWGIFQLVNHGLSSLLEKLNHELEEFYKLPLEEKMKFKIRPGDFQGYGTMASTGKNIDWCDRFYMVTNPVCRRRPHLLPELPSSLRNTLETYLMEVQKLGMELFGFMAKKLKMELKEMNNMFEDGMQSVRMSYYPPCPQPELVIGFGAHTDASGLTILNQVNGVDGLQIKKDGVWSRVSILPGALIINVGDILEILSNGLYHSVEHRAGINAEKERISIAIFLKPKLETDVGPAISLVNPLNPPKFKTVSMQNYVADFFSRKLVGRSNLEAMRINPTLKKPTSTT